MDATAFNHNAYDDDDARYAAICRRDVRADGRFVTGVLSTGVYCRPSCGARTPLRRNVRFFDTPRQAEVHGLRACKRCAPDVRDDDVILIERAAECVTEAEEAPKATALAERLNVGPAQLRAAFRRTLGLDPSAFIRALRGDRLRCALQEAGDDVSVLDAMMMAGFSGGSRGYAAAEDALGGVKPASYKKGGAGARLCIAYAQTSLGRLGIAATEHGVAAIAFGDDDAMLKTFFLERFPEAEIVTCSDKADAWLAAAVAMVEEPGKAQDLPLDVRATAFQARVWAELKKIPLGETISYAELARRAGNPKAVRAAASCCARNPVPLTVPCHRVIGSDGAMTGYAFGKERKEALLDRERAANGGS